MEITVTRAETPEAKRWVEMCHPVTYWDLDFSYYGLENVVFPSSYSKWSSYIRDMSVRENDVWIISFPRCGNTWTSEMVWLLGNGLNYDGARKTYLQDRCPFLEFDASYRVPSKWDGTSETNKPPTSMEIVAEMDTRRPRYIKSHLPLSLLPKELLIKKPKIIYVTRNPKDACVSYYHHNVLLSGYKGTMDLFAEAFITDNGSPLSNSKNSFMGTEITPDSLDKLERHLAFEQMKKNPSVNWEKAVAEVRTTSFADVPPKTEFIREGKVGAWKEEMSLEWVTKFNTWISENGIPQLYS